MPRQQQPPQTDTQRQQRADSWGDMLGKAVAFGMNPAQSMSDLVSSGANAVRNYMSGTNTVSQGAALSAATRQSQADLARRAVSGVTLGLDQRAQAAAQAAQDAAQGQNFAQAYQSNRQAVQRSQTALKARTGATGDLAEVAGSLALPIGGAGKVLEGVEALRGAPIVSKVARSLVGGAGAGGIAGAATGAAQSQDWSDLPETAWNTLRSGGVGALVGAGLGLVSTAATPLAQHAADAITGNTAGAAARATEAGQQAVLDTINKAGGVPAAEDVIQKMTDSGVPAMVADTSSRAQSALRGLTDKGTEGSDAAAAAIDARRLARGSRVTGNLEDVTGQNYNTSSAERTAGMRKARLDTGETDYAPGGIMDQPVNLTQEQQALLQKGVAGNTTAEKTFQKMHAQAQDDVLSDPTQPNPDPNQPTTLRVVDQMLRNYKDRISTLFSNGLTTKGTGLRNQFDALRKTLTDNNSQYADIVNTQARGLAQERAAQMGQQLAPNMLTKPRDVLQAINNPLLHPDDKAELRYALVDHLLNRVQNSNSTAQTNQLVSRLQDTNNQPMQDLGKFLFGDQDGVDQAVAHMTAEQNAMATEKRMAGSGTSTNIAGANTFGGDAATAMSMIGSGKLGWAKALMTHVTDPQNEAANEAALELLTRKMKPGDLTRLQLQAQNRLAAR
ncbi:MAG TPA: hypothetical protein VH164_16160, partial [Ktedonobacteraceae bacterium]|nr:hypothetical protein [Ktedonobacteraceae bacterium]